MLRLVFRKVSFSYSKLYFFFPRLSFDSFILIPTNSVSLLRLSIICSLCWSSYSSEHAFRTALKISFVSLQALVYFISLYCTGLKSAPHLYTAVTCWAGAYFIAMCFWPGSTKGQPTDRQSFINIYFAVTSPLSAGFFLRYHFRVVLFWFFFPRDSPQPFL